MDEHLVSVKLDVVPDAGNLVALLTFQNVSKKTVYLDKYSAGLVDEPIGRLFEITDQNGNKLRYIGISIKRKFDKNDFVALPPGESLKATVLLDKWYEFHAGSHKYLVSYEAFNHSYGEQALFKMVSNKVSTEHTPTN